ncbi:hypothetical protein PAPYR_10375 [Paratrimastix pyriformis]|uniref:Uncharacterized protein n=1 Tax=Paratrimastix pyriformis TaxID=342808 RepID=A0ABQ8U629_9EUKA|nr:hypothetical protein PAPYR_10375 [Paratrimastix pyriformis]
MMTDLSSVTCVNKTTTPTCALWERLPPELLRAIVEAAPNPSASCYILLLSLSHSIRTRIRGTPRELSFDEPNWLLSDITPTAEALAALVGPCKALDKLSFPFPTKWWDLSARDNPGWVEETFGGHAQLAVLALPCLSEGDVGRILCLLPGLVELSIDMNFDMNTHVLTILAHSCPGLRVLKCSVLRTTHLAALAPLLGGLERLELQLHPIPNLRVLTALVCNLSSVSILKLPYCPPAALGSVASHLTSLKLSNNLSELDLPGPWFCRLETLSLRLCYPSSFSVPLARLLASTQATLHSLTLKLELQAVWAPPLGPAAPPAGHPEVPPLMAALRAMPHLTRLHLIMLTGCSISALPPDLLDRLERLNVVFGKAEPDPVRIVSRRLRRLCLEVEMGPTSDLALNCPALEDLDLSEMARCHLTSVQCPRLRTIRAALSADGLLSHNLPDLDMDERPRIRCWTDPDWLTGMPQLRVLSYVRLTQPDLVARLCASESLIHLEELHLDVTRLPNPLILRLPGQLERLDLHIEREDQPVEGSLSAFDLQVAARGLLGFSLTFDDVLPAASRLLLNCPSLVSLDLKSPAALFSVQVDEEEAGTQAMQPRKLTVDGLEAASLLGLLTRHGARLCHFRLWRLLAANEDWPQLMGALSEMPRLTKLYMRVSGAVSNLSLSCPQLQELTVSDLRDELKVVLACPRLKDVTGIRQHQMELVLPAPKLETPPSDDGGEGDETPFPFSF